MKNKRSLMRASKVSQFNEALAKVIINTKQEACVICSISKTPQWRFVDRLRVCNRCYLQIQRQSNRDALAHAREAKQLSNQRLIRGRTQSDPDRERECPNDNNSDVHLNSSSGSASTLEATPKERNPTENGREGNAVREGTLTRSRARRQQDPAEFSDRDEDEEEDEDVEEDSTPYHHSAALRSREVEEEDEHEGSSTGSSLAMSPFFGHSRGGQRGSSADREGGRGAGDWRDSSEMEEDEDEEEYEDEEEEEEEEEGEEFDEEEGDVDMER
uniref:GATA-type domain-containing protein n=1 Tax=Chromera velia CCMP2878 TaxID=1169474 RepID=A0A0K6S831_9ALVE|eukprot:Cvel_22774.t3-p1 / transcript=Cvel_22774.t3 / gene=Cvel_22774 / organism=Chromera_velia_CCMP2878 / gene_product=hypothetical protein / transcript_product=hypothetical protein / location=Cvel_scaffold2276:7589-8401(-) / protein_length=271 / sequence_SO=supercontig / SO=protein_coding / is_pseudo=false